MSKERQGDKMAKFAHRLRLQDNISTDQIVPARYRLASREPKDLSKHIFEDVEEGFAKKIKTGDFLVAGSNFGCGSSRDDAAAALKASGLNAVIAKSFSRIFYRNAFNIGLCLVECETNYIDDMDELALDLDRNLLMNLSKGVQIEIKPVPRMMKKLLAKGGVIQYFKEHRNFAEFL